MRFQAPHAHISGRQKHDCCTSGSLDLVPPPPLLSRVECQCCPGDGVPLVCRAAPLTPHTCAAPPAGQNGLCCPMESIAGYARSLVHTSPVRSSRRLGLDAHAVYLYACCAGVTIVATPHSGLCSPKLVRGARNCAFPKYKERARGNENPSLCTDFSATKNVTQKCSQSRSSRGLVTVLEHCHEYHLCVCCSVVCSSQASFIKSLPWSRGKDKGACGLPRWKRSWMRLR